MRCKNGVQNGDTKSVAILHPIFIYLLISVSEAVLKFVAKKKSLAGFFYTLHATTYTLFNYMSPV
jgi:hypothetical protein